MTAGASRRILGLVLKDVAELRRNPAATLPALWMAAAALVPAFLVVVGAPMLSGESLGDSREFTEAASLAVDRVPELAHLDGIALVQAFLFHQFSPLLLLLSVVAAMALASHAVIGEKVARTLEPLLATPLSATELLTAKTLTPFIFSVAIMWLTLAVYVTGIAMVGEAGVWTTFLGPRTVVLFLVVAPLLTVVSLLLAVIISSRVNDPRAAQQLGALVVLPITAIFVAQLMGQFVLGLQPLLLTAAGLAVLSVALLAAGVWVFDRERILMQWK